MIFRKATSDKLKSQLDNDLSELIIHEDRIIYLDLIRKLRNDQYLDIFYKDDILGFFDYVECKYEVEKDTNETKEDWSGLFKDLIDNYIKDISLNDFNVVMNHHWLPKGKGEIIWIGKKAEAVFFQKEFGFTMRQLNECFVGKDGTKFAENNRLNKSIGQTFIDLLRRHKQQ
jgi:hypothetical protein